MRDLIRAALVIARRDYVATVFSKTFLLFLLFPLLPLVAGGGFGALGATQDRAALHPTVAVVAGPEDVAALGHAAVRLRARMGEDALPSLRPVPPAKAEAAQVRALLADPKRRVMAVMTGGLAAPVLTGPRGSIRSVRRDVGLIVDEARQARALGVAMPPAVVVGERPVDNAAGADAAGRTLIARGAQVLLMFLTMVLAGMLLSTLVEEKSSKVIEVLAAAVPVDAIFLGKLFAMLAMSFTFLAVWGVTAGLVLGAAATAVPLGGVPAPAVGWPMFGLLGVLYFTMLFLLLGALFLGIGGQASTAREVQMMSLPVTMGQLGVLAFATVAVATPDAPLGIAAAVFPWSSPFAMIARAAQVPALWPHLLALAWQALWIALVIRFTAGMFRRSVLKSGGGGWRGLFRRRLKPRPAAPSL